MSKFIAHSKKHFVKYKYLSYRITSRQNYYSDFNELAALDRSIILDIIFFSSSPIYAYIRRKQKWHENCQCGTLNIYTYIVVCIILNKLYLVGWIRGLYRKWIMQWNQLSIRASQADIWCMSCNTALETHFMHINVIRAQDICLNTDSGIRVWWIYLCLGTWNI